METETGSVDPGERAPFVEALPRGLADSDGPTTHTPPSDSIDPDALEAMVTNSPGVEHVRFEHDGTTAKVRSDGTVLRTDPE